MKFLKQSTGNIIAGQIPEVKQGGMIEMGLRVNIEGLRFRASDGKLNTPDQLRLIGRRLSNPAVIRLRAGRPDCVW